MTRRDIARARAFGAWLASARPELTPAEVGASYARAYQVPARHAAVRAAVAGARAMRRRLDRAGRFQHTERGGSHAPQ